MRSLLILLTVSVCLCSAAFAQGGGQNYVGFKGGISIPKLSGSDANELSRDYKSRLAPNFGVFFDLGVTEKFSVQPEVNFAGQGGKRNGIQPVTGPLPGLPPLPGSAYYYADFKNTAVLNYLELPVLAKYKFGESGKKRIYVNGGVFYGHLMNAKTITKGSSTLYLDRDGRVPVLLPPLGTPIPPISFNAKTDIKNDVNTNNFGFTGGGGFEIPSGKNYFLIDARVSLGMISIQKDTIRNGNSKTGNLVISVGYAFNLK